MGAKMKSSVAKLKPVKVLMNVRNAREVTVKDKSGYVVRYAIGGTKKAVSMSNVSHPVTSLHFINKLYQQIISH